MRLAAMLLLAVSMTGCNAVLLVGYLIGGPPSIEPDFEKQGNKSLAAKDTKVLVLCYAPTELKWDNEAVDFELAKHVAYRLNMNKIKVVDPDRVNAWLDKNHDWDKPSEVGAAFDVEYVIYIDIKEYSLYEQHSANLYRGRADAIVSVVKMEKNDGQIIYSKDIASRFPTQAAVAVDSFPYNNFKKLYLSRLSDEIGQLFYEHFAGDEIPSSLLGG
jgi:hypothetical protein